MNAVVIWRTCVNINFVFCKETIGRPPAEALHQCVGSHAWLNLFSRPNCSGVSVWIYSLARAGSTGGQVAPPIAVGTHSHVSSQVKPLNKTNHCNVPLLDIKCINKSVLRSDHYCRCHKLVWCAVGPVHSKLFLKSIVRSIRPQIEL